MFKAIHERFLVIIDTLSISCFGKKGFFVIDIGSFVKVCRQVF